MINRRIILVFLLLMFSASLMTFQSTRGPLRPFGEIQHPLFYLDNVVTSLREDITAPLLRSYSIKRENEMLKMELEGLRLIEDRNRELERENLRLMELLNMKSAYPEFVAAARVISSGIRQWPKVIVINKGGSGGVRKDMVVRSAGGLVGKVTEVFPDYSNVILLTDVNFSASVRLEDSRTEGVLSGTGNGLCQLKYIPLDEEVNEKELVVTSGLDRIFPAGIPVGYVKSVRKKDALFQDVEVEPFVSPNRLEEVMVFKR